MSPRVSDIGPGVGKHATAPPIAAAGQPMLGALYMTCAAGLFAGLNGLVKQASLMGLDPLQIAFLRSVFAMLVMLPLLVRPILSEGLGSLKPIRPGIVALRAGIACIGVILWLTAVTLLPLVEVTAISFTSPLFATIGSTLILREVVRIRRWTAILVGFVGVLIILRPGMVPLETGALVALAAALGMAAASLLIKLLTRTETTTRIVFWTNVGLTLGTLIPALTVWVPMTPVMWLVGAAMGVIAVVSHIFLTNAFAAADASVVLPFDYTRLPFVAVIGYVFFGQTSDLITWAGAAVIAGSAFYVAHREQQLAAR